MGLLGSGGCAPAESRGNAQLGVSVGSSGSAGGRAPRGTARKFGGRAPVRSQCGSGRSGWFARKRREAGACAGPSAAAQVWRGGFMLATAPSGVHAESLGSAGAGAVAPCGTVQKFGGAGVRGCPGRAAWKRRRRAFKKCCEENVYTPGSVYTGKAVFKGRSLSRASTCAFGLPQADARMGRSRAASSRKWSSGGGRKGCPQRPTTTES